MKALGRVPLTNCRLFSN